MINLSVNLNKIATLRNARGEERPSVVEFAKASIEAGVHGITVHPRPDERHITYADVFELKEVVRSVEYNIEGYPDERYCGIVQKAKPDQATLVPDPPDALTSDSGWDVIHHFDFLNETIQSLHEIPTRVSLFINPDSEQIDAAKESGADRIELYTKPFADAYKKGKAQPVFETFARAASRATEIGLGINAGHDLDLQNLTLFRNLPGLLEVSIGHALISDALVYGWDSTIAKYLNVLNQPN